MHKNRPEEGWWDDTPSLVSNRSTDISSIIDCALLHPCLLLADYSQLEAALYSITTECDALDIHSWVLEDRRKTKQLPH